MEGSHSIVSQLKAVGVLASWGLMLLLAMPLCDTTKGENYATEAQRDAYRAEIGWPWSEIVITAAWMNRAWRDDLVKKLSVLERPLANRQYWNLYPIWGPTSRSLDIVVDGELVHRSQDAEHAWLPQVRERRLCYAIDAAFKSRPEWLREISTYVVERAREDFPEATSVALHMRAGPYSKRDRPVKYEVRAEAPEWSLVLDDRRGSE